MVQYTTLQRPAFMQDPNAPIPLGADLGNETALIFDGTNPMQIPSYIGSGNLQQLIASRSGGGIEPGKLLRGEYVLFYKNRTHYVGDLALREGIGTTNAIADIARYFEDHTLILLLTMIAATYHRDVTIHLDTGLPPKLLKDHPELKGKMASRFLGRHPVILHDEYGSTGMVITIAKMHVAMESVAALATLGDHGVPCGIVDIGGHSFDVAWFDRDGRIVDGRTGSLLGAGTARIGLAVSRRFRTTYGRELTSGEITEVLDGYTGGIPAVIYHKGAHEIPDAWVDAALDELAPEQNTFLSQKWAVGTAGEIAVDGAFVLVIGGGALFQARHRTLKIDTETRIVSDPHRANVQSYYQLALRLDELTAQGQNRWPYVWEPNHAVESR